MTDDSNADLAGFRAFAATHGLRDLTDDQLIKMAAGARRAAETGALIPRQSSKWATPPATFIISRL